MIVRQPRIHVAFRVAAAVTVVFWLLATSYCSVEDLFGVDHNGPVSAGETSTYEAEDDHDHTPGDAAEHHHGKERHSHGGGGHSQGSHTHDGKGDLCCSTLQAFSYAAQPIVITKPVVYPLSLICAPLQARASILSELKEIPDRPPPSHDRVFTPEVCTGPANRSHAPPAFV